MDGEEEEQEEKEEAGQIPLQNTEKTIGFHSKKRKGREEGVKKLKKYRF